MKKFLSAISAIILIASAVPVYAFTIEKHDNVPVENNFVVGPAKIEAEVKAGESQIVSIDIDNKTGRTQMFILSFEDFVGTNDPDQTIKLLGTEKSSTTLKDYLSVEKKEFTLDQGDRAIVPVTISIPVGTPPGGRFGSVIVSATSQIPGITDATRTYAGAVVIGRIATLLFVTVPGATHPEGHLVGFTTKNNSKVFFGGTIPFRILFQNTGDVNLNPYGMVVVKNIFGQVIASTILDPWFALPDSERTRDVVFSKSMLFGEYTAVAEVNRGYGNIVDEESVSFFVIPLVSVALMVIILVALVALAYRRARVSRNNTNHDA